MKIHTLLPLLPVALLACKASGSMGSDPSVAGSASLEAPQPASIPSVPTTEGDLQTAAKGDGAFAARLYARLDHQEGNLFFSPASIRMALAMTYAGARGETAREMASALSLEGDPAAVDKAMAATLQAYAQADAVSVPPDAPDWRRQEAETKRQTLHVVNRLWGQTGRMFLPEYKAELSTYYGAPLVPLDFQHDAESSRHTINEFIDQQTEHKIVDLLPPGSVASATRLVLTNAVYFKASWEEPFSEAGTQDGDFFAPGGTVRVKLMHEQHGLRWGETPDAQVLELPYASGKSTMVVVLPKDREGLGKLEATLSDSSLAAWTSALQPATVNVTVPRFKTTSSFDLVATLREMGVSHAFDCNAADFTGIDGTRELCISAVVHKAYVAVDEKGTEAAAATGVAMKVGAVMPEPQQIKDFRADHPFLFFVRDIKTGSALFMGRVVDPTPR